MNTRSYRGRDGIPYLSKDILSLGWLYVGLCLTQVLPKTRAELACLRAELAHLRAELACLKAKLARLRAELAHLRAELARLRAELGRLRGELGRLSAELGRQSRVEPSEGRWAFLFCGTDFTRLPVDDDRYPRPKK